jgi:ribose transport system permease protein
MSVETPNPSEQLVVDAGGGTDGSEEFQDLSPLQRGKRFLRFQNIGVIYVWIAIIIVFWITSGSDFLSVATFKSILNENAVSAIVALAVIAPLSAQTFDLSIGYIVALTGVICSYLLVNKGIPVLPAVLISVAAGVVMGIVNAIVVVGLRIDSFIATLATGALMSAATGIMTSNGQSVVGPQLSGSFAHIGNSSIGGVTLPVFYALAIAFLLWILLELTVTGRRLQAVGFSTNAARLAGIKVDKLRVGGLLLSGTIGAVAGVTLTSQLAAGTPSVGPTYLLNAFTAAFLGATQFKAGRFNAWGTLVAVLMLGTGTTGLVIVGAAPWVSDMFTGVVLIAALATSNLERAQQVRAWAKARRESRGSGPSAHHTEPQA